MMKSKITKLGIQSEHEASPDLLFQYGLQMTADYRGFDLENLKKGNVETGLEMIKTLPAFEISQKSDSRLFAFAKQNATHLYILHIDASTPHREMIPLNVKVENGLAVIRIIIEKDIHSTIQESIEIVGQGIVVIEIELKENAQLRYVAINSNSLKSDCAIGRFASVENGGELHWFDAQMGGSQSQSSIVTQLNGSQAQSTVHGFVLAHDHQKPDVYHAMIHTSPSTHSSMLVKSVAAETSSIIYRGLIHLKPDAQHADAKQKEDALILSSQAMIQAVPELRIENNEVKCSRGVTSGRLNSDKLFYLLSRGFSEEEARKALVMAHLMSALNGIEDQELRSQVQVSVESYIEQHL